MAGLDIRRSGVGADRQSSTCSGSVLRTSLAWLRGGGGWVDIRPVPQILVSMIYEPWFVENGCRCDCICIGALHRAEVPASDASTPSHTAGF